MEASRAEASVDRGHDWPLVVLLFGSVLVLYGGIALVIYVAVRSIL